MKKEKRSKNKADTSKKARNPLITSERSRRFKARNANKKQKREEEEDVQNTNLQNVEELNIVEQNVEHDIVEEQAKQDIDEQQAHDIAGISTASHSEHMSFGGPKTTEVISNYNTHIGSSIWKGKRLRSKGKRTKRSQSLSSRSFLNDDEIQELSLDDSSADTPKAINHEPKRKKRGITKMKGMGIYDTPCSAIEVEFNEKGQPIGDNSITLSSFVGALVRSKVSIISDNWKRVPTSVKENLWNLVLLRFKLDETHKDYILQKMSTSLREYRCHVGNGVVKACKLEEEEKAKRLAKLKPSNLTDQEWRDFITRRTSPNFQAKSIKMKQVRKKHTKVHAMSRQGYARLEQKLIKENPDQEINRVILWTEAHINKERKPTNKMVEESMKKIQHFNESQPNTSNLSLENDALSLVLGKDRHGQIRGLGFGVTKTMLRAQSHSNKKLTALDDKVRAIEAKLEMLMKSNNQELEVVDTTTPDQQNQASDMVIDTLKKHDPPIGARCKLMSWYNKGEVVGVGKIFSTNSSDFVHCVPLGLDAWKVSVDSAVDEKALLWRSTDECKVIGEAVGTTVAWSKQFISFDFS